MWWLNTNTGLTRNDMMMTLIGEMVLNQSACKSGTPAWWPLISRHYIKFKLIRNTGNDMSRERRESRWMENENDFWHGKIQSRYQCISILKRRQAINEIKRIVNKLVRNHLKLQEIRYWKISFIALCSMNQDGSFNTESSGCLLLLTCMVTHPVIAVFLIWRKRSQNFVVFTTLLNTI